MLGSVRFRAEGQRDTSLRKILEERRKVHVEGAAGGEGAVDLAKLREESHNGIAIELEVCRADQVVRR